MQRDCEYSACTTAVLLSQRVKRLVGLLHSPWDHRGHSYLRSRHWFRTDLDHFRCEDDDCNLGGEPNHFVEGCAASNTTPGTAITYLNTTLPPSAPSEPSSRSISTAKATRRILRLSTETACGTGVRPSGPRSGAPSCNVSGALRHPKTPLTM